MKASEEKRKNKQQKITRSGIENRNGNMMLRVRKRKRGEERKLRKV